MITFHDWIISGGNRLSLLGDCLATARESGVEYRHYRATPRLAVLL